MRKRIQTFAARVAIMFSLMVVAYVAVTSH